jgi:3-isopropylmalate/(R)-2-methylmalate dehydratase small subunit
MTGGRVFKVGAEIDTDQLAPGAYMKYDVAVIAQHCLEAVRPGFAQEVKPGDVLVAGPSFGIGSSREQAAAALFALGVRAVVAPSFGGLFFRNAFNAGLLLLTCEQAESIAEGERVTIHRDPPRVEREDGTLLDCEPVPGFLMDMIDSGGLLELLKRRFPKPEATLP